MYCDQISINGGNGVKTQCSIDSVCSVIASNRTSPQS